LPDNHPQLPTEFADAKINDAPPVERASSDAGETSPQAALLDPPQHTSAPPDLSGPIVASHESSVSDEPVRDVPAPLSSKEKRDEVTETPSAAETPLAMEPPPNKPESPPTPPPCSPTITADTKFTGDLLKQVRQSRGLTLERVAEITKINIFYLRTIEEERYSNLPAEVYVRGYLRMVCQLYGLDTRQVTSTYVERLPKEKS
jgi:hypothetical protein